MNKISFYFSDDFKSSRSQIYLLIDKVVNENKIFLYCGEIIDQLDKEIWTFSQQKFIPHLKYEEISDAFEASNTNLIIFDKLIIPDDINKPNFIIFIDPPENYINFINENLLKKFPEISILVFFSTEYKNQNLELFLNFEHKIFSASSDKIWKEIKK